MDKFSFTRTSMLKKSRSVPIRAVNLLAESKRPYRLANVNFKLIRFLGRGASGVVYEVVYGIQRKKMALKVMNKSKIAVLNQSWIGSRVSSNFLLKAFCGFQDDYNLYILQQLAVYGDMRNQLKFQLFDEEQLKFITACIVIGLEDLRTFNLVHHDLKPQNLLLCQNGYVKIADLGLTFKPNQIDKKSKIGTLAYMAPEKLFCQQSSFQSDYYSLGVILYQLITGQKPLKAQNREQLKKIIIQKQAQLPQKSKVSKQLKTFVDQLLERKADSRLGKKSIQELKNHAWLCDFNWQKLREERLKSPIVGKTIAPAQQIRTKVQQSKFNDCLFKDFDFQTEEFKRLKDS